MVIHLVLESCVVMAFSSSSKVLFFFNFLTKDLTAFSDHFSSCSFLGSPLRQPSRRFTISKDQFQQQYYRKVRQMASIVESHKNHRKSQKITKFTKIIKFDKITKIIKITKFTKKNHENHQSHKITKIVKFTKITKLNSHQLTPSSVQNCHEVN